MCSSDLVPAPERALGLVQPQVQVAQQEAERLRSRAAHEKLMVLQPRADAQSSSASGESQEPSPRVRARALRFALREVRVPRAAHLGPPRLQVLRPFAPILYARSSKTGRALRRLRPRIRLRFSSSPRCLLFSTYLYKRIPAPNSFAFSRGARTCARRLAAHRDA